MEFDSRYNGGNFVRKLTFFCWLVHMTDIFPPLGFPLHPNNHCDIPGKIREIEPKSAPTTQVAEDCLRGRLTTGEGGEDAQ